MKIFNRLADSFKPIKPLPAGLYHLHPENKPLRIHLRLHQDGSGLLILNASTVLRLNRTAAEYAYHYIKGTPIEQVAQTIASRYRISKQRALEDYTDFAHRIQTLIETPDLDPVSFLDLERVAPHSANLTAPLRLDCALTYRLPEGIPSQLAPTKRVTREMTTDEWRLILNKAWSFGIPHVTFTGGEPTLRDDLSLLIQHAESLGMVCGLLSNGLKLAERSYLETLLQTGLDHLMFVLQPTLPLSWQALSVVLPEDLYTTVHLTLTPENVEDYPAILEHLASLGVNSLSLSASDPALAEQLHAARHRAAELQLSLRWDLPVPYSAAHPAALETAEEGLPDGAGCAWLYVEPDGDVLPAQGHAGRVLGNLLTDSWEHIYPASH